MPAYRPSSAARADVGAPPHVWMQEHHAYLEPDAAAGRDRCGGVRRRPQQRASTTCRWRWRPDLPVPGGDDPAHPAGAVAGVGRRPSPRGAGDLRRGQRGDMRRAWAHAVTRQRRSSTASTSTALRPPARRRPGACGRAGSSPRRRRTRPSTRPVARPWPWCWPGRSRTRTTSTPRSRPRLGRRRQVRRPPRPARDLAAARRVVASVAVVTPDLGRALRAGRRRGDGLRDAGGRVRARGAARDHRPRRPGRLAPPTTSVALARALDEAAAPATAARCVRTPSATARARPDGRRVRAAATLTLGPGASAGMIGYYVHHVGHGHLHRARAVARALGRDRSPASRPCRAPDGWPGPWIELDRDDAWTATRSTRTAGGGLHWAPLEHDAGCGTGWRRSSAWIERPRPDVGLRRSTSPSRSPLLVRLHGDPGRVGRAARASAATGRTARLTT